MNWTLSAQIGHMKWKGLHLVGHAQAKRGKNLFPIPQTRDRVSLIATSPGPVRRFLFVNDAFYKIQLDR